MFRKIVFLLSTLFISSVSACTMDGLEGLVPKNSLKIPADSKTVSDINEVQFNEIIEKVEVLYAPTISNLGATLKVERNWTDGTVNAFAQQYGKTWTVKMMGGLARHEAVTKDGLALAVCHEIGHHIAGAPFYTSMTWAGNEGQSDYFSTTKCLRRLWMSEDNAALVAKMKVPDAVTTACTKAWSDVRDLNICIRSAMAGASIAKLFADLRKLPAGSFTTPDTSVVVVTLDSHPAHQCRLDTYFQGALCEKAFTEDFARDSEVTGACHGSTGQTIGVRPTCWFKPLVK